MQHGHQPRKALTADSSEHGAVIVGVLGLLFTDSHCTPSDLLRKDKNFDTYACNRDVAHITLGGLKPAQVAPSGDRGIRMLDARQAYPIIHNF